MRKKRRDPHTKINHLIKYQTNGPSSDKMSSPLSPPSATNNNIATNTCEQQIHRKGNHQWHPLGGEGRQTGVGVSDNHGRSCPTSRPYSFRGGEVTGGGGWKKAGDKEGRREGESEPNKGRRKLDEKRWREGAKRGKKGERERAKTGKYEVRERKKRSKKEEREGES